MLIGLVSTYRGLVGTNRRRRSTLARDGITGRIRTDNLEARAASSGADCADSEAHRRHREAAAAWCTGQARGLVFGQHRAGLYSIRSERQLVEQINYNLLYRWFVGLSIDDAVWNHSVFSENRDRLIEHDAVTTVQMAKDAGHLSGEHFSVDGRTTRHVGYEISQRKRKCIEQCFGWGTTAGGLAQVMVRGLDKVDQVLTLTMAAYNLTRMRTLHESALDAAQ